jgi:hypothetical protein
MSGCCRGLSSQACIARPYGCADGPIKTENIRRAERKEWEARNLLREAAYLRDLEKRLDAAGMTSHRPRCKT